MSILGVGIEVVRYMPELKAPWDALVARAKNPNFLFLRDYMDYHQDRFADHSLMFFAAGRALACLPANETQAGLQSHQGLTFGGLVMHRDIRLNEVSAIVGTLRGYLAANRLRELVYRPMPYPYHELPAEEDLLALHQAGAVPIERRAAALLRAGPAAPFSVNRRKDLKRCRLAEVEVKRSSAIAAFMRLCAGHLQRRHSTKPVHSAAEMVRLADRFPENIQLYTAKRRGETIGGMVMYRNDACSRLQYVGLSAAGEELGAEAAIVDHILRRVLKPGSWLDLGTSNDPATGALGEGLYRYKESLGARAVEQTTYRLSLD
jgi:hypothetical protein